MLLLCGAAAGAFAQKPVSPKWELYGGYSALDPGATVHGVLPGGVLPSAACLCWDTRGAGASATYNFASWVGLTADVSADWSPREVAPFERFDHAAFYNVSGGPKFTLRTKHVAPFAEVLAGGHRLVPELYHPDDKFGFMAGGGIDIPLGRHVAFRAIRADYVHSDHRYGLPETDAETELRGVRLQTGIVFMFGGKEPMVPRAEPVPPPMPAPAPVVAMDPPTVTCSANPATVNPGDSSVITANGASPQNRPLTYSYVASAGSISGSGSTANLLTAGAASGPITVTCEVADDRGQTASQTTEVMVAMAAVAPAPVTSDLCTVAFARDTRRPARVDNEAKGCLDEVALNLQRTADATLALVGNAGHGGSSRLAARRAVNTKAYLVNEKGIDASRVRVYTGSGDTDTVSTTMIPAGASLKTDGDTAVDESQFKADARVSRGRSRGSRP